MKFQELKQAEAFDLVEPPVIAEAEFGASAAPDLPTAAGGLLAGSYVAILGAFVVTIQGARADFAMVIAAFYIGMFFAVPALFLRLEKRGARRPSLREFLDRGVDTATGHISGAGALVQMLVVPVLLFFGILSMGITYLVVMGGQ